MKGEGFEDLIRSWDGEEVLARFDEPAGAWMFVCVHSTLMGPATGGVRMKTYATPHEALLDCMRLSSLMTLKTAVSGLPMGGGKSVIAVPEVPAPGSEERRRVMERFGMMVGSLQGTYWSGPDMNTSEQDMDVLWDVAPYTFGRSPARGGSGDSAPDTAEGVLHGIKATVARAFGSPDLSGRTVLVEGVGGVGSRLAELLAKENASLLVADIDQERVTEIAERLAAGMVAPGDVIGAECDVYAPCAVGWTVNEETIPRLRCRAVAGAANNQLGELVHDAERLRRAGILYAPDYVINAGGAFHLIGYETLGWSRDEVDRHITGIGDTMTRIFERADEQGISTELAAERIAKDRLAKAGNPPTR
ncbi:MAG TPA: Glu/Leu/Phe/Val dehydrogenase dimerization domain-containing protein [Actinomycetota bacterium]|jgi:leucine dehydrogenase